MNKNTKFLIILFCTIVLIKIILSYFINTLSAFSDEYIYAKMARNFFYHGLFTIHQMPTNQYPPLYPITISIAYFLGNMKLVYFGIKVINALTSSAIIFPVYYLTKEITKKNIAKIASVTIAVIPATFSFTPFIMSENLFYPLVLFTVYFMYKNFTEDDLKWKILLGIFLGMATLTRSLGLILVAVLIICCIIFWIMNKKVKYNQLIIPFIILVILWVPWMVRNGYHFGFTLPGMLKAEGYSYLSKTFTVIPLHQLAIRGIIRSLSALGYLILGSGIILGLLTFLNLKKTKLKEISNKFKHKNFLIISIVTIFGFILLTAKHGSGQNINYVPNFINYIIGGRIIGRYIDSILPLFIILGLISLYKFKIEKLDIKKITIIGSIILAITSIISIYTLFPVNNMSVILVGIFKLFLNFTIDKTTAISGFFSWYTFAIITTIFILLSLTIKLFFNKGWLNQRRFLIPLIFFFLFLSILNYGAIAYNVNTYWRDSPQNNAGIWLNEFDSDTNKTVLYDERDCKERVLKLNQEGICEPSHSATISGFWINKDIIIGNIEDSKNVDYIISNHDLNFKKIYDKDGIKIYKVN